MNSTMRDALTSLVEHESPSGALDALDECTDLAASIATRLAVGTPVHRFDAPTPAIRIGPADAELVMIGHLDTVHPFGTLRQVPFRVEGRSAYGPGVFDMKAGVVLALHVHAARPGKTRVVLTTDEEIGSPSGRHVIESEARSAAAALVLEPSLDGRTKTSRSGVDRIRLVFHGRAAHAGLDPHRGVNALLAMSRALVEIVDLGDVSRGTTVTPTVAHAGTTTNTVPDLAEVTIDLRTRTALERARVLDAIAGMARSSAHATGVEIELGPRRPPLEREASEHVMELAQGAARDVGYPELFGVHAGGGSDGNFTAALGVPTLDGLGPRGSGAHTLSEVVDTADLEARVALLVRLIDRITEEEHR